MPPKPMLTDEQRADITAALAAGESQRAIAARLDISQSLISKNFGASAKPEAPETGLRAIPLEALQLSNLNPRKHFDEASILELSDSIHANGLLQNLVVREQDGAYIVISGERRLRALRMLAEDGAWDGPVSCKVVSVTDAEHLALALVENLQRVDMDPLDEAAGYQQLQALDPETWGTAQIATRIGRTQRYVQQRLALADKLIPQWKTSLTEGVCTLSAARFLTTLSAAHQLNIFEEFDGESFSQEEPIGREHINEVQHWCVPDEEREARNQAHRESLSAQASSETEEDTEDQGGGQEPEDDPPESDTDEIPPGPRPPPPPPKKEAPEAAPAAARSVGDFSQEMSQKQRAEIKKLEALADKDVSLGEIITLLARSGLSMIFEPPKNGQPIMIDALFAEPPDVNQINSLISSMDDPKTNGALARSIIARLKVYEYQEPDPVLVSIARRHGITIDEEIATLSYADRETRAKELHREYLKSLRPPRKSAAAE